MIEFRVYVADDTDDVQIVSETLAEELKDMLYNAEPEVVDVTYEIKKGDIRDDKPKGD